MGENGLGRLGVLGRLALLARWEGGNVRDGGKGWEV
jgi:hypothetical protein